MQRTLFSVGWKNVEPVEEPVEESIVSESPDPSNKKNGLFARVKMVKSGITIGCRMNKKKAQLRKSGAKSVVNSLKKPLDNNIMAKNSSLTVRLISMEPIM